jgi:hypothetical protein
MMLADKLDTIPFGTRLIARRRRPADGRDRARRFTLAVGSAVEMERTASTGIILPSLELVNCVYKVVDVSFTGMKVHWEQRRRRTVVAKTAGNGDALVGLSIPAGRRPLALVGGEILGVFVLAGHGAWLGQRSTVDEREKSELFGGKNGELIFRCRV